VFTDSVVFSTGVAVMITALMVSTVTSVVFAVEVGTGVTVACASTVATGAVVTCPIGAKDTFAAAGVIDTETGVIDSKEGSTAGIVAKEGLTAGIVAKEGVILVTSDSVEPELFAVDSARLIGITNMNRDITSTTLIKRSIFVNCDIGY